MSAKSKGLKVQEFVKEGIQTARERISLVEEEGQKLAKKFVQEIESRIPDPQKKAFDGVIEQAKTVIEEVERNVDERIEKMLNLLNIPTRSELDRLERKIDTLTKRVNSMGRSGKSSSPSHSVAA